MRIYADQFPAWAVFLIVLGFFTVVAIVAYIIHRIIRFRLKDDESKEKDEKQFAQEELDRILQPVEDEKIAKQIEDYKEEDE